MSFLFVYHNKGRKYPCNSYLTCESNEKYFINKFNLENKHSYGLFSIQDYSIIFINNPTNREEWNERLFGTFYKTLLHLNNTPLNQYNDIRGSHNSTCNDKYQNMPSISVQLTELDISFLEYNIYYMKDLSCGCLFHLGNDNEPDKNLNYTKPNPKSSCLCEWLNLLNEIEIHRPIFLLFNIKNNIETDSIIILEELLQSYFKERLYTFNNLQCNDYKWLNINYYRGKIIPILSGNKDILYSYMNKYNNIFFIDVQKDDKILLNDYKNNNNKYWFFSEVQSNKLEFTNRQYCNKFIRIWSYNAYQQYIPSIISTDNPIKFPWNTSPF